MRLPSLFPLAYSLMALLCLYHLQLVETEVRAFSSTPISASPLTPAPRPPSGHFAPATAALFTSLTKPLAEGGAGVSKEEAIKIILSERENYELAQEIVRKEGMDVDLVTAELAEGASLCLAHQRLISKTDSAHSISQFTRTRSRRRPTERRARTTSPLGRSSG